MFVLLCVDVVFVVMCCLFYCGMLCVVVFVLVGVGVLFGVGLFWLV